MIRSPEDPGGGPLGGDGINTSLSPGPGNHRGTPCDPFDDQAIGGQLVKESTGTNDDICAAVAALT